MKYEIIGAEGRFENVERVVLQLKELGAGYGASIQLMDAKMVYGKRHLESSVLHAERAFRTDTNLSGDMAIEVLLYSSGERQIKQAISKMGISEVTTGVAVVICIDDGSPAKEMHEILDGILEGLSLKRNDSLLEGDRSVLERFGIDPSEIENTDENAWGNIILSRVAMVDLVK